MPTDDRGMPNVRGVRLAPDGNNEEEFQCLFNISQTWKQQVAAAHLSQSAAEFRALPLRGCLTNIHLTSTCLVDRLCSMVSTVKFLFSFQNFHVAAIKWWSTPLQICLF